MTGRDDPLCGAPTGQGGHADSGPRDVPGNAGPERAARQRLDTLFRHCRPEDAWFRALIEAYRLESRP